MGLFIAASQLLKVLEAVLLDVSATAQVAVVRAHPHGIGRAAGCEGKGFGSKDNGERLNVFHPHRSVSFISK